MVPPEPEKAKIWERGVHEARAENGDKETIHTAKGAKMTKLLLTTGL